jgi:hypothetical protein
MTTIAARAPRTTPHAVHASHARSLALFCVATACGIAASGALAQTCTPTLAQTEGPYYRSPNPETTFMRIGADGPLLNFRGRVVDTNCNPIPWTWVALWHADPAGAYDNTAPFDRYRATYFADANGEFEFETIIPGLYPGRTKHIHIKLDGANTNMLTTQFYFPGVPQNQTDGIYNAALLIDMTQNPNGSYDGFYEFVLPVAGACTGATITSSPASATVDVGGTATFTAAGAGSTPRTFRWYRDGVELSNDARTSGALTGSLTITGVTAADAGQYTCRSANSCGSQLSAAATLTVPSACAADLDGDGAVGGGDIAILLNNWGRCKACDADLTGDGLVDGQDLASLLGSWGPC